MQDLAAENKPRSQHNSPNPDSCFSASLKPMSETSSQLDSNTSPEPPSCHSDTKPDMREYNSAPCMNYANIETTIRNTVSKPPIPPILVDSLNIEEPKIKLKQKLPLLTEKVEEPAWEVTIKPNIRIIEGPSPIEKDENYLSPENFSAVGVDLETSSLVTQSDGESSLTVEMPRLALSRTNYNDRESPVLTTTTRRVSKNPERVSSSIIPSSHEEGETLSQNNSPSQKTATRAANTKSRIFSPSMRPLSSIFMAGTKTASNMVRSLTAVGGGSRMDTHKSPSENHLQSLQTQENTNDAMICGSTEANNPGFLQKGKSFFKSHFTKKDLRNQPKMFGILADTLNGQKKDSTGMTCDSGDPKSDSKTCSNNLNNSSVVDASNESINTDNNLTFGDVRKKQLQKLDSVYRKEHKKRQIRVKNVVGTLMSEKKYDKLQEGAIDAYVTELVSIGFTSIDDRDDIYYELLSTIQKMRTSKDKGKSVTRGVELLSKCACFFTCSDENAEYFISKMEELYFLELKQRQDILRGAYVLNIWMKHLCVYYSESIKLDASLVKSTDDIVYRYSFFDSTLNEIMEMQTIKFPNYQLPWIIIELCESVLINDGRKCEGIFRLSGDALLIDELRKNMLIFRKPPLNTNPNISASLLKSWFRDILDPMIKVDMYDTCIKAHDDCEAACKIILSLPKLQRDIICYIAKFVRLFMAGDYIKVTRMDYSNMALVWSPNLLRSPHTDPLAVSKYTTSQNSFIKHVFEHLDISSVNNIFIRESADVHR